MKFSLSKLSIVISLFTLSACALDITPPKHSSYNPPKSTAGLIAETQTEPPKGSIPANAPIIKVGLLLPLSGESANVGNAMLDAATMALSDSYLATPAERIRARIVLIPKDTGNTPASSAVAAQQAIDEGVKFIIGPLFSQSVTSIMPLVSKHNIPVLSFSNNKAIAGNGAFAFGFLPEQQVDRISEYAYLHNYQRIAMLVPNDAFGQKIRDALVESYKEKGGVITPVELYAPSPANINAAVARLTAANTNAPEDRRFQAIYIADSASQMRHIIPALKQNNVPLGQIKLLGTGLWDDPDIAKMPEMQGAWFPSSPPSPYKVFERRFKATYGQDPIRLTSLAYDAVTLVATLAMSTDGSGITPDMLTKPEGFIGPANSLYRLNPSGESERKLSIMEVTPDGFKVIDPASLHF